MTRKEFDKRVEKTKKEILNGGAYEMYRLLKFQNDWRNYGIEGKSFDKILTEIAQALVLDVDLIENVDIDGWIKEL